MIFRRRSRSVETYLPEGQKPPRESSQAMEYSERRLHSVQEAWPEVQSVAERFKKLRIDNHFADRIREAHRP